MPNSFLNLLGLVEDLLFDFVLDPLAVLNHLLESKRPLEDVAADLIDRRLQFVVVRTKTGFFTLSAFLFASRSAIS